MSSLLAFPAVTSRRPIKYRPASRMCRGPLLSSEGFGDESLTTRNPSPMKPSHQSKNVYKFSKVRFQETEVVLLRDAILSYEDLLCLIGGFVVDRPRMPIRIPFQSDKREQLQLQTHPPCLQLAEFFWRSAQQLGCRTLEDTWHPNFRTCTKFTVVDVKRWRRFVHTDWKMLDSRVDDPEARVNVYNKVSNWFLHRWMEEKAIAKVFCHHDLSQLVSIVNSCIYLGTFQFQQQDVVRLCNTDIEHLR
ncbi:hypothetical protein ABG067_006800 [Albugo candida]